MKKFLLTSSAILLGSLALASTAQAQSLPAWTATQNGNLITLSTSGLFDFGDGTVRSVSGYYTYDLTTAPSSTGAPDPFLSSVESIWTWGQADVDAEFIIDGVVYTPASANWDALNSGNTLFEVRYTPDVALSGTPGTVPGVTMTWGDILYAQSGGVLYNNNNELIQIEGVLQTVSFANNAAELLGGVKSSTQLALPGPVNGQALVDNGQTFQDRQNINTFSLTNTSYAGTGAVVPEPATWAMMLAGFGLAGLRLNTRRRAAAG